MVVSDASVRVNEHEIQLAWLAFIHPASIHNTEFRLIKSYGTCAVNCTCAVSHSCKWMCPLHTFDIFPKCTVPSTILNSNYPVWYLFLFSSILLKYTLNYNLCSNNKSYFTGTNDETADSVSSVWGSWVLSVWFNYPWFFVNDANTNYKNPCKMN